MNLSNPLIVVGFCLATVGAAGFHEVTDEAGGTQSRESLALPLFAAGLGLLAVGAFLRRGRGVAESGEHSAAAATQGEIEAMAVGLRDAVAQLDAEKTEHSREELVARIDHLLRNDYFDLTSRHEEYAGLIGFAAYSAIWEGIANAERLLARAWSMATDGHLDEALAEIPLARENLERAAERMGALGA